MRQHRQLQDDQPGRHPAIGAMRRWAPVAAAAALAAQAFAASPAQAVTGTTVTSSGFLRISAQNGVANDVKVALLNSTFQVSDADVVLPGPGCTSITRNLAECVVDGPNVSIDTADGDDVVTAPVALPVTVTAGPGDDTVTTGAGDDKIFGEEGADVIAAGPGEDRLTGAAGGDVLGGGTGIDLVVYIGSAPVTVTVDDVPGDGAAGEGDDVRTDVEDVQGGSGGDTITGSDLAQVTNRLVGGAGDDTLIGLGGHDELVGQNGADKLMGGDGLDELDGGKGADVLSGGAGEGDNADYSLRTERVVVDLDGVADDGESPGGVSEADNVLTDVEDVFGGSGQDRLTGSAKPNFLDGGDDSDTIFGGDGADVLLGGAGFDSITGDGGADRLEGGADGDTLIGGAQADDFFGGGGVDVVNYVDKGTNQPVTATLDGLANDGTPGELDRIRTDVENLSGGLGGDTLTGDQFANVLHGGFAGGDVLKGLAGNDTLDGNIGTDTLDCGADVDQADGGAQVDTAVGCETVFNVP